MDRRRVTVPEPFGVEFDGPEGPYTLKFRPTGEWDGLFDVNIAGRDLTWSVEMAERNARGELILSGFAVTKEVWGDSFWFELKTKPPPAMITYWGNQVIWRTDSAAA